LGNPAPTPCARPSWRIMSSTEDDARAWPTRERPGETCGARARQRRRRPRVRRAAAAWFEPTVSFRRASCRLASTSSATSNGAQTGGAGRMFRTLWLAKYGRKAGDENKDIMQFAYPSRKSSTTRSTVCQHDFPSTTCSQLRGVLRRLCPTRCRPGGRALVIHL
jgi:hypothetical protein